MHEFVSFNRKVYSNPEVNHPVLSNSKLYGKGVFTTIAIRESKPFLWRLHWQRLIRDSEKLGIDLSAYTINEVRDLLGSLIEANKCLSGRSRITFFDDSPSGIWTDVAENVTSLLIQTAEFRAVEPPVTLTTSPYPINSLSPLAGVKSCNYLENVMARDEAGLEGYTEAIRVNERNEITSACMANIFWTKGETLFTPSLRTGCLAGTTREFILRNWDVSEVEADLAEFDNVDSIFLTSAGIGIVQVGKFKDREFEGEPHKITTLFDAGLGNGAPAA